MLLRSLLAALSLGSLVPAVAQAAIAVNQTTTTQGTVNNLSFSHSVAGSDRLLLVSISYVVEMTDVNVASVTFDGLPLTELCQEENVPPDTRTHIFGLVAPPAVTGPVAVIFSGASGHAKVIGATSFTGVDQVTPTVGCTTSSGSTTVNVASAAGHLVYDSAVSKDAAITVGPGQAQLFNLTQTGTAGDVMAGSSTEPGASSVAMSWSGAAEPAMVALDIQPSGIATSVQFAVDSSSGSESVTPANLAVNLSATSGLTITVNYAVSGGTATGGGTDYTLAAGMLTFNPGETSKPIPITIVDDALDEMDETVVVTLSSPSNANLGPTVTHTYTITDNDAPPTVAFADGMSSGSESITPANLDVNLSAASGLTVTVNYAVSGGTATGGGTDYTLAAGTLTFNPGETSKPIPITIVDDALDETNETVVVTLSSPSNANLGATVTHTLTITDDDPQPTVAFAAGTSSEPESVTPANLDVNLSAASGLTVTVDYAVSGGTATGGGTDYTLAAGTLTFNPGETSKPIPITIVDDTLDEADETVEVTLSSPSNAVLGSTVTHTYTITDNDPQPAVTFADGMSSGSESITPANLDVSLSAASGLTVTVNYAVSGGTATGGGTDYTLAAGTLTFNPGEASKPIALLVTDDLVRELDETVEVTLSDPVNATLGATASHLYTILDDEPATWPYIVRNANLRGAVGAEYVYNALRAVEALGADPIVFSRCDGPAGFKVDRSGGVRWIPAASGSIDLCVAATNSVGSDQYSFTVQVLEREPTAVVASLSAAPTSGQAPLHVQFDSDGTVASPDALPLLFQWDFGDESSPATGDQAVHDYAVPASYQARLIAADSYGSKGTATERITVRDSRGFLPPIVEVVASATSGQNALTASFSCNCQPGSAPIAAYIWEVDGVEVSAEPTATVDFSPGRHQVSLTVVDGNGLGSRDSVEVAVSLGERQPPHCVAWVDPPAGQVPLLAAFSGRFWSEQGTIASQHWDLGIERIDDQARFVLSLSTEGRHTAWLEVTDELGVSCRDDATALALAEPSGAVRPRVLSRPNLDGACGVAYSYSATRRAAALGSAPLTWGLEAGPSGMSVDPTTGEVRWTPTSQQAGPQRVVLAVANAAGTDQQEFFVQVDCVSTPLAVGCGCAQGGASSALLAGGFLLALGLMIRRAGSATRPRRARPRGSPGA